MKEIKTELFQYLSSLKTLYLHDNNITYIQRGIFENLMNLEKIYLNENKIENILARTFADLPSLKYLDLSNNRIQNYEDGAFLFLPNINYIDLRNNNDMMCECHLPALVNYTKSKFGRTVNVQGECETDSGNNQNKLIPIMEYSQCKTCMPHESINRWCYTEV
uniref:LRRCT domain-containing protein n=1 Tax=Octopus bimaculoides TaxID=37653 RepID=A0A0L8HQA0_OCTBM